MDNFDPDESFLQSIDKAVQDAASLMDMGDVGDMPDEDYDMIYEARHHCGTCMTRTVMETVWPEIEKYINYLKYRTN